MVVISAVLKAKAGREKELEALLQAMIPLVQQEEGTVEYVLHRAQKDSGKFFFYEKYRDQAALEHHMGTPYLKELFKKTADLLAEKPEVEFYEDIASIQR